MAHLYTYNPLTGLSAGFLITFKAPLRNNPARTPPPHLRIDSAGFIGVNTRWQNAHYVSGRLLRSSLTTFEPEGKKAFYVFDAPRQDDDFNSLVFIDTSVPKNMKRRADTDVNAWTGIRGEGIEVIKIDTSTGAALIRCEPNASIELLQFDGSVYQLRIEKGEVSTVRLSQQQMAALRVEQFKEQIDSLDLSLEAHVRRLHGILNGAVRLVRAVKDAGALAVLVDFLTDHQATMPGGMRKEVRFALLDANHPAASTFFEGYEATNVVRIQSSEAAAARAKAEQKRRDRANKDRERTLATKNGGKGNGGGQQQSSGKKGKGK